MRGKRILRRVAASAVALSMVASLSAPAFAATFNISNGRLTIKADYNGNITVRQAGMEDASSIGQDEEIIIEGTYGSSNSSSWYPSDGSSSGSSSWYPSSGSSSASYQSQDEEEAGASSDSESKAVNGGASASAEAPASASSSASAKGNTFYSTAGDHSASSNVEGLDYGDNWSRNGVIEIISNAAAEIKLTLKNAIINATGDEHAYGHESNAAAIDIVGKGDVTITIEGKNELGGAGKAAGIQKNYSSVYPGAGAKDDGKLTITAKNNDQRLTVRSGNPNTIAAIGGGYDEGAGSYFGTKNIEINNGTIITEGRIGESSGSPWGGYSTVGGDAEDIVITGDAVVNANGGIGSAGKNGSHGKTSIKISGNAKVSAVSNDGTAAIGGGSGNTAGVIIEGNAKVDAKNVNGGPTIGNGGDVWNSSEGSVTISGTPEIKSDGFFNKNNLKDNASAGTVLETVQNGKHEKQQKGDDNSWTCAHEWGAGKVVAPTCVDEGYTEYTCSLCSATKREGIKPATNKHNFTEVVKVVEPTYESVGYTVYKCTNCNATEIRDEVPMLVPEESNGTSAVTIMVNGMEVYESSCFDDRYIITVPEENAVLTGSLGNLAELKAQGADTLVFRTKSRETALDIDAMLSLGAEDTLFTLTHSGSSATLTVGGADHSELIH